jgi:hypothetical protein
VGVAVEAIISQINTGLGGASSDPRQAAVSMSDILLPANQPTVHRGRGGVGRQQMAKKKNECFANSAVREARAHGSDGVKLAATSNTN